ncbi:unnamed protein product [Lupinus luteus]|uniref:U-box domain-containing protein n=1 Tax=Lupinus luteus TaxID=3873 RepID=A0AAV1XU93_LUPLU
MNKDQMTIPHLFRCPISLDLFEDPVTLCTGQTYDRSSIEKWFSAGNLTCPVTMQRLHDPSIIPNNTLRHLIHQWLQLGPQFDPGNSATITTDSLAAIKVTLESHEETLENKLQALEKIRVLLSDENCSFDKLCFLQLGFLALLLELVFGKSEAQISTEHMDFIELALSCILKLLPLRNLELLNMTESAAASQQTEELCCILGNNHKLVHEIVLIIIQNYEVTEYALKAMSALCSLQCNREALVRGGALDGIITYISSLGCERTQKNLAPLAMSIMEKLMVLDSAKEALVNHPKGIETLVNMVFRVSDQECSQSAVELLLIVCGDFEYAREESIEAGVLNQLLLLLQSQCGPITKSKSRMLLKLLRSKCT